jgi:hypothetical protein
MCCGNDNIQPKRYVPQPPVQQIQRPMPSLERQLVVQQNLQNIMNQAMEPAVNKPSAHQDIQKKYNLPYFR